MFTEGDLADHPASTEATEHDQFGVTENHDGLADHGEHGEYQAEHPDDLTVGPDSLDATSTVEVSHDDPAGTDLVLSGPNGQVDLGAANVSSAGHGELDAVAVQADDGAVEVYVDGDHNGTVDEAIRIDPDGHFSVWTSDGHGGWAVAATGHVDSQGHAQVDKTIDPDQANTEPSALDAVQGVGHSTPVSHPTETTHSGGPSAESYPGVAAGDIAVASDGHYLDAGPAKYDMDGDGRAETAVVESDGRIIQVSDTDGDGRADEMLQVDTHTHQAVILVDDGSGEWQVAASGHVDASGDFVEDGVATHTDEYDNHGDGSVPDIVYTSAAGAHTDLGAPNQDLDGDGRDESVAVKTSDGNVLVVSDTNADGSPDQIILIDGQSGEVSWAVPDGHGGWDVVRTGHIQSDGSLVVNSSAGSHTSDVHTSTQTDAGHHPATTGPTAQHDQETVSVTVDGRSFDAGPATIDSDGDGVPDTVAVPGPGGTTLFYEDSNGDGVADQAWTTDASGQVTATYQLNAAGSWAQVEASEKR